MSGSGRVVVLTGGVGGAKLVLGLMQVMDPARIVAVVNTGDDFQHLGLDISPDIDTLLYTLADKADRERGWGRQDESWAFMAALRSLGGEDWFQLGDGDLAIHVLRTARLRAGETLGRVTAGMAASWGLAPTILPMTDDRVATMVDTDEGELSFQRYFVARRCEPRVQAIRFDGADAARPAPGVVEAIVAPDTQAILIAPSNPWLSIDPILAVPGIRDALVRAAAPVVAVSPLVGGQSVKGPTAKLMGELGLSVRARTIAAHYAPFLDAMLVDAGDPEQDRPAICCRTEDILMRSLDDRARVARATLALAESLRR